MADENGSDSGGNPGAAMGFSSFGKQKPPSGSGGHYHQRGRGDSGGAHSAMSSNTTLPGQRQSYMPPPFQPQHPLSREVTAFQSVGMDFNPQPLPGVGDDYRYTAARDGYSAPGQHRDRFEPMANGGPRPRGSGSRGGRGVGGGRGGHKDLGRGGTSHPYPRPGGGLTRTGGSGGGRGGPRDRPWCGFIDKEFGPSYFKTSMLGDPWEAHQAKEAKMRNNLLSNNPR